MYTVFGGNGFIGKNVVKKLRENNINFFIPDKNDENVYGKELRNIIYCAGVTSDFRKRPYDTVEAHVSYLSKVLKTTNFQSFIYLSSTRVYFNSDCGSEEANLSLNPNNSDDLFNISKLMGESICLNSGKENVKILRISNVCGDDFSSNNFLYSIIKDAVEKKEIILNTTLDSEKDYINIEDVTEMILKISKKGKCGIYNIASGKNLSNDRVTSILKEITDCNIRVSDSAKTIKFPIIQIKKIKEEFNFNPIDPQYLVEDLLYNYMLRKR